MANCCDKTLTTYIVSTAYGFCGEQHGEEFARRLILEAGISLKNKDDAKEINKLGEDYVAMVRRFTSE